MEPFSFVGAPAGNYEDEALSRCYQLLLEAGRRRRARLAAEREQEQKVGEQEQVSGKTGWESNRVPIH